MMINKTIFTSLFLMLTLAAMAAPGLNNDPSNSFSTAYGVLNGMQLKNFFTTEDLQADKVKEAMLATIEGKAPIDIRSGQVLVQEEIKKLQQQPEEKNINPKFWTAMGTMIVESMKMQGLDVKILNVDEFIEGLRSALSGKPVMDMQQAQQIYMQEANKANEAAAKENIEAGKEFLAENAKREAVSVLESGVQYEILEAAEGAKPTTSDKVKVHYHGTLIDGTIFDSSVERGTPATFGVTQVIPGWVEILQLMPVGSKWKVYIPSDKAYGNRGQGNIQPGSTLIFEIELIDIVE